MFFFSPSPETKNQRDYSEASCLSLSTTFVVLFHSVLAYATRSTQHNNRSGNSTTFSLSSLINIASLLFAIKKDETRFCIRGNIHLLGGRKDGIYIYIVYHRHVHPLLPYPFCCYSLTELCGCWFGGRWYH